MILETVEHDNTASAGFTVASDGTVEVLERGFGDAPWDNQRSVHTRTPG